MRKVIFLDRDGVINIERGDYTYKLEDFRIVDGFFEALKQLQAKGFEFIIITNQGGISKRRYSKKDVLKLNNHIKEHFSNHNILLLDIYFCPHHSDLEKCICRKPDSLMLEKAIAKYNVDTSSSYFIGDSERDVVSGKKAGLNTLKINSNENLNNYLYSLK